MALQSDRVIEVADLFVTLATRAAALRSELAKALAHNSHLAIDWGAAQTPAYISEEANGNLSGRTFSRQAVSNAIFSLDQLVRVLGNQSITQGDHLGNLNQLARAQ